jgi:hypothetical protein
MTESERIDYAGGQISSLMSFVAALVKTHQNPSLLKKAFSHAEQVSLALAESQAVSESYLEGQRDTRDSIAALLG